MARFFKKSDDDKKSGSRFVFKHANCRFTAEKVVEIDYKDVDVPRSTSRKTLKIMPARLAQDRLSAPADCDQARAFSGPHLYRQYQFAGEKQPKSFCSKGCQSSETWAA